MLDRVIGDLDGQALDGRVERWALGHRPGAHRPVDLEAQVEVMRRGGVLLHDEDAGADAADRELLVALDSDVVHRQVVDDGAGRAPRAGSAISPSTAADGPSACTATVPSSALRTQPMTPSSRARSRTASRKPTPWTVPAMRARIARGLDGASLKLASAYIAVRLGSRPKQGQLGLAIAAQDLNVDLDAVDPARGGKDARLGLDPLGDKHAATGGHRGV